MTEPLPTTQYAVQLVGPGELLLNPSKPVPEPGPHHVLVEVEAVGLCFSDLKLLKQFDKHPRKGEVIAGVDPQVLKDLPGYVPGTKPGVPGHEMSVRVVKVGEAVEHYKPGERWLVQPDFRPLRTASSNGALGYAFEGALQQFLVLDERILGDPSRPESYMIPASEGPSASAIALIEPWGCVEDSYASVERRCIRPGGRLLVVADPGHEVKGLRESLSPQGAPCQVTAMLATEPQLRAVEFLGVEIRHANDLAALPNEGFDDIVYFGHCPEVVEVLNDKAAFRGIVNVVLAGEKLGRTVNVGVGRIHYALNRWVGTTGDDASDSYKMVPQTGEVRPGDAMLVVGAGGPMGQMHVIRALSTHAPGLSVTAADIDGVRLKALAQKAKAVNPSAFRPVNTREHPLDETFSYISLMAPVPELVVDAIGRSRVGGIVNLFAGIPVGVKHPIDLDAVVEKRVYVFGTSGSETDDMRAVLRKAEQGMLDPNMSVGAVSGMAGAIDGLAAVEHRTLDGKIIVYPALVGEGLIPLPEMADRYPSVAAKMPDGHWCKEAELEFLRVAKG